MSFLQTRSQLYLANQQYFESLSAQHYDASASALADSLLSVKAHILSLGTYNIAKWLPQGDNKNVITGVTI